MNTRIDIARYRALADSAEGPTNVDADVTLPTLKRPRPASATQLDAVARDATEDVATEDMSSVAMSDWL